VLDEAQHALSRSRGSDTLFALKAARDALNLTSGRPQLAILATGSARAKIADMVMRKSQPFYGASTETFPQLDESFVAHFAKQLLSRRIAEHRMPQAEQLMKAFRMLGSRPEDFRKAIRDALVRSEPDLGEAIVAAAHELRNTIREEVRKQLAALSALQRAIVKRMVESGDGPSAFSKDSIAYYRKETGERSVSTSMAQKAMKALVARGFVWRSSRGVYALDDTTIAELFYEDRVEEALLRELTGR